MPRMSSDVLWAWRGWLCSRGRPLEDMFGFAAVINRLRSPPTPRCRSIVLGSFPDQHGDPTTQENEPVSTQTATYNVG